MGYYYTTSPENAVPGKSCATPKTHTPDPPVKERGARFYSPELSRWLSRDPIEEQGGLNLYGFVKNHSTYAIDVLGLGANDTPTASCPCKNESDGSPWVGDRGIDMFLICQWIKIPIPGRSGDTSKTISFWFCYYSNGNGDARPGGPCRALFKCSQKCKSTFLGTECKPPWTVRWGEDYLYGHVTGIPGSYECEIDPSQKAQKAQQCRQEASGKCGE